jgi:hypothetical protein
VSGHLQAFLTDERLDESAGNRPPRDMSV